MDLTTQLIDLGRLYKMAAKKLTRLNLFTVRDLLYHIPHRYENYTIVSKIGLIQAGETVTIQGRVVDIKNEYRRSRFVIQKATIEDETGSCECVWFNQPYIINTLKPGTLVSLAGRAEGFMTKVTMQVREYEVITPPHSAVHTVGLVPVYPETSGISSKWMRNRIRDLLIYKDTLCEEYLDQALLKRNGLLDLPTALANIHFPESLEMAERARKRLAFDELLLIQLAARLRKDEWDKKVATYILDVKPHKNRLDTLIKDLPFELTHAQQKALTDIYSDLANPKPMNRLLQGDVGSGKTVVAAIAMYLAHLHGLQSALMAPTEILATQHYETITRLLSPLGVTVQLFTSATKKKKQIDPFHIAIGTHALLNQTVEFEKLGIVVIDEQQRFGVEQRTILREKGENPHFLTMTATPIPRTIYLTIFGDLELSYLNEMPKGRKQVKTWLVPNQKREAAYEWIKGKMLERDEKGNKNQVFLVCPFIEESESMEGVRAATTEFEVLKKGIFRQFNVALLHGKMKAKEKDQVLQDFQNQKIDLLVATPVVEVGIDIPNATVIVIEAAERFGLSQLHQLRGRVGRNERDAYCLLFTESKSPLTQKRLSYMEHTHLGAELAELDLELRGPGQIHGTLQHGKSGLKIATFSDPELIELTRREADDLFPTSTKNQLLMNKIVSSSLKKISPD